MNRGLPGKFVIIVGPEKAKYPVYCSIKRPPWKKSTDRDDYGVTSFAPRRMWVFRFKDPIRQLIVFAHELGHAVVHEHRLNHYLAKNDEKIMVELVENIFRYCFNLGPRFAVWQLRAGGSKVTVKKLQKQKKEQA